MAVDRAARKDIGAYYTDAAVAAFLTRWAVRAAADRLLDPSCGEGVFLSAASNRLRELGGDPSRQVYGVELDPLACQYLTNAVGLRGAMQVR